MPSSNIINLIKDSLEHFYDWMVAIDTCDPHKHHIIHLYMYNQKQTIISSKQIVLDSRGLCYSLKLSRMTKDTC